MQNSREVIDKVLFREGTLILPTYEITGENRNPVFRSQYGVAHIYPYTLQDEIASKPRDKEFHTLTLENRYLLVTVITDLGGRVYSVFDKIANREVFYKNSVLKFSPLAIRGAFFSGGVEFSFPVAHAPTTADPVNWDMHQNDDGSASIIFGGREHISNLRWMISLTLFPNRCALAQDVLLYNSSPIPGRFHYWTNASLEADNQTEFIYPLRRARSYEFAGTASWPYARLDLTQEDPGLPGMEGVPMWPADRLQKPVNFRWQKNMLAQVSIFGRNVEWDFFGAWRHSVNHGYAHYAKARDVAGMKLWSWGNASVGIVNQTALTDDGSVYAETQCGAMETQLDFDFLQPGEVRTWREWWLPLRGLGGLTCASAEIGARLQLIPQDDERLVSINLGICPIRTVFGANILLNIPKKTLLEEQADLTPELPWQFTTVVDARELAGHPIQLTVTEADGKALLDYTLDRETSQVEPYQPESKHEPSSAEDYYKLGLHYENFDNRLQAKQAYQQALALATDHAYASYRYGLMLLRSADFDKAKKYLDNAAAHGIDEANFYLGLLSIYLGQIHEAENFLTIVKPNSPAYASARTGLGQIALRRGNWESAIRLFEEACQQSETPFTPSVMLAVALRRAGREEQAQHELKSALNLDPLNHLALREMSLSPGESGSLYREKLERLLSDDPKYRIDLACSYMQAGLFEDALAVLNAARPGRDYAMLSYLAGYVCYLLGKEEEASQWFQQGSKSNPDYIFPSRLEEILALEKALDSAPEDAHAKYYLANFLSAHERPDESQRLWEESLTEMPAYDVLLRNLGIVALENDKDLQKAAAFFEKALGLNPNNYDLYMLLNDIYKTLHLPKKQADLLAAIKRLQGPREDVRKLKIAILVDLGQQEEALEIMTREKFVPLEMDQSFHDLYSRAWMLNAQAFLEQGKTEDAISCYQEALKYPENIGVGRPVTSTQAEIYFRLGCAYETLGLYKKALGAWHEAAGEHHCHNTVLYEYVQKALDKLSRYSELGIEM
jgi:tetratricopeptide (TPR) repeat protein